MNKIKDNRKKSMGYRFAMLHRLQVAMSRSDILGHGLKPGHLPFIIRLIEEGTPVTQDYLSGRLVIDKGCTARAVHELEKNGYVTRRVNPENRRQNLVSATQKGREAVERLLPSLENAAANFVRGFTEQEKEQILNLLDRMISNAREAVPHI